MRVNRVEFRDEYKLGAAEARYIFTDSLSTAESTNLPVPEKAGCEVHLLGDWVMVIEVWKDKKHERAAFVAPREAVKKLTPTAKQALDMLEALA